MDAGIKVVAVKYNETLQKVVFELDQQLAKDKIYYFLVSKRVIVLLNYFVELVLIFSVFRFLILVLLITISMECMSPNMMTLMEKNSKLLTINFKFIVFYFTFLRKN